MFGMFLSSKMSFCLFPLHVFSDMETFLASAGQFLSSTCGVINCKSLIQSLGVMTGELSHSRRNEIGTQYLIHWQDLIPDCNQAVCLLDLFILSVQLGEQGDCLSSFIRLAEQNKRIMSPKGWGIDDFLCLKSLFFPPFLKGI